MPSLNKCNNRKLIQELNALTSQQDSVMELTASFLNHFERVYESLFRKYILSAYDKQIHKVSRSSMGHWQRFLHPFPWKNNLQEDTLNTLEYVTSIDNIFNFLINYTSTDTASINAVIWIHSTACRWFSQCKDELPSDILIQLLHHLLCAEKLFLLLGNNISSSQKCSFA